jgi:hypothetical protein
MMINLTMWCVIMLYMICSLVITGVLKDLRSFASRYIE